MNLLSSLLSRLSMMISWLSDSLLSAPSSGDYYSPHDSASFMFSHHSMDTGLESGYAHLASFNNSNSFRSSSGSTYLAQVSAAQDFSFSSWFVPSKGTGQADSKIWR